MPRSTRDFDDDDDRRDPYRDKMWSEEEEADYDEHDLDSDEDEGDLRTCPHCRAPIYADVIRCPNCETYITEAAENATLSSPTWVIVTAVILLILMVLGLVS